MGAMQRLVSKELDAWLKDGDRRALVIRGARQVGKTWLVRDLAERHGLDLVEIDQVIVPVELKAGASGSMKSLHQFIHDKRLGFALRVDTNPPSMMDVRVTTTQGDAVSYGLLSLPGYLVWRVRELVRLAVKGGPG